MVGGLWSHYYDLSCINENIFTEMVEIGERGGAADSDSDNDSGGFEVYEGNKLASRQPTFWMGTQNGL